jgi:exonuclease III
MYHCNASQSGINHSNLIDVKIEKLSQPSGQEISFGLVNARSIKNKTTSMCDYISENQLDIVAITETWLGDGNRDQYVINSLCPSDYNFIHAARTTGKGGGVGLLLKSNLPCRRVTKHKSYESFEYLQTVLQPQKSTAVLLCVIYRPPPNRKNGLSVQQFFDDFSDFLDSIILSKEQLLLVGDFNFHVDVRDDKDAMMFTDLLLSYGLTQHVSMATHSKGHTLDLLITRDTSSLISTPHVHDAQLSDHFWVHCNVSGQHVGKVQKEITYRKLKSIDKEKFGADLRNSLIEAFEYDARIEDMIDHYNSVLSQLIDAYAPERKRTVTLHSAAPWYDSKIGDAKRARRKAERKWRKSKLTIHRDLYLQAHQHVNSLLKEAKENYYRGKVEEADDQKSLFKIVNTLLGDSKLSLPSHHSREKLANRFSEFFTTKITNIRKKLEMIPSMASSDNIDTPVVRSAPSLTSFIPASEDEIQKIILSTKSKHCSQDPIPTWLLKDCLASVLPWITMIVNQSLKDGVMPSSLKKALIVPLLKKPTLDPDNLKNYRPVSNLTYLSKVIERVVAKRLLDHMENHSLHEPLQSAYKKYNSTETALLKVQNDILCAIDGKKVVLLVLLDLSAAFDTVDHDILLTRLAERIGLQGSALKWFKSYVTGRLQSVYIDCTASRIWEILFGVPQGSVLGPILFIIYTSPLGDILRHHGVSFHFYADDTQIYLSFNISSATSALAQMEKCVSDIRAWMATNFLSLNDDKTEVIVCGTKSMLSKLNSMSVTIGDVKIQQVSEVRNIGALFNSSFSLDGQVSQVCRSAWYHLRNIGQIRPFLDRTSAERLIHAFVTSKLDNLNSLLYNLPKYQIHRLQRVQNAAARLINLVKKVDHITPILIQLHWLPIKYRIQYKLLLLTYKALHGQAPAYLQELLTITSRDRSLRSNTQCMLLAPRTRTSYGDRSFSHGAPELWNSLPFYIKTCTSVHSFKHQLKTYLFNLAY